MMVDTVHADLGQTLGKFGQVTGHERCWQNYDFGGAEIEWFAGRAISRTWIQPNVIIYDLDDALAQGRDRSELTHVYAGQLFRQGELFANGKGPMSKVIGKSFADKVVLLQGAEGVLEDRVFRT